MSEKPSLEFHISADLPIKDVSDDKLNRGAYVEALAEFIRYWRDKPSVVIGLFGDWGSGKSSLKNLVLRSISQDKARSLHIVEFSPWQVSGQELLSGTFFEEISRVLGQTGPSEEPVVKRRVARWKKYAAVLSMAGSVARNLGSVPTWGSHSHQATGVAATVAEGLAVVVKTGAEALEAEGAGDSLTLSERKEQISNDLRSLDKPILVVLDDVDRLTKEEIRHILQLIKANADFPNIIYLLLAQKESVLNALEEVAPVNALAYLEKIVQVSFDVPVLDRKLLWGVLVAGLNKLLDSSHVEKRFQQEHWFAVSPHLFSLFRNLRDVNRFLGALAFHVRLFMNGDTFEVNSVDLIALEAIRLFEPNVYKRLPGEKGILTPSPRWGRKKEAEADKRQMDEVVCLSSEANSNAIKNLLGELFPPSKLKQGVRSEGRDVENKWFDQLRVCSDHVFDRYFQFATPTGDVSQSEIDSLVESMADAARLRERFARFSQRKLLEVIVTRIAMLVDSLPLDPAAIFLAALYEVTVEEREYGLFEVPFKRQIPNISYQYLQRLSEDLRIEVLEEALRLTVGLSLAIDTVNYLAHEPNTGSPMLPFFKEPRNRDRLNQAGYQAIVRATSPDSQISPEQILPCTHFWANFDKASAREWLDAYLVSRSAMVNYLGSITTTSQGTGGTRRFTFVASFEQLISIEELEAKVHLYLGEELAPNEAELVRLFTLGVRKRREGKDDMMSVWTAEEDEF